MTEQRLQLPTQGFVLSLDTASDLDICVVACEVTGEGEHGIYVWDLSANKALAQLEQDTVAMVRFCKNDTCIIYPNKDYVVVKDWRTLETVYEIMVSGVKKFKVSPNGKRVLLAGEGRTLQVWDLESGKAIWEFKQSEHITSVFESNELDVSWPIDNQLINGRTVFALMGNFISDSVIVLTGGHKDQIVIMDIEKNQQINHFYDGPLETSDLMLDHEGRYLFTVCSVPYGNMMYDLSTGMRIMKDTFIGELICFKSALFGSDSKYLITGSASGTLSIKYVDNKENNKRLGQFFQGQPSEICHMQDSEILVGAERGNLYRLTIL